MNAPATIRLDENEAERAYRRAIGVHCACSSEMEMAARVDLAMLRDQAAIGITRGTDSAAALLGEVSRLATVAVYAPRPESDLLRLAAALKLTMMAARAVDRATRDG